MRGLQYRVFCVQRGSDFLVALVAEETCCTCSRFIAASSRFLLEDRVRAPPVL